MTSRLPRGRRSHRQTGRANGRPTTPRAWRGTPVVVILLAAGLLGWSTMRDPEPAPGPPAATELPLSQADLTCPAIGAARLPAARAGIGLASVPLDDSGRSGDGGVELRSLPDGKATSPQSRLAPGDWYVHTQDADESATVVSATGSMASGASAYAATVATDRAGGGLAVADCAPVGQEMWFVGAGSTVDHESTLLVSNPGETEAIVDVSLLTADGSVEPASTNGLVVGPGEVVRLGLTEFAAGEGEAVVRVAATQGQIAASLLDNWSATLAPAGTEWIPQTEPPATSLLVSPLIEDADQQDLIVGNPADRTANVDIQVVGADGTFPVQGFESVTVDPGGVQVVSVPRSVESGSLRLDADQQIVAAARSTSSGSPVDLAYGTNVPEVSGPAVVPVDLPTVDPSGLSLAITSADPAAEASVSIEAFQDDGSSLAEQTVTVPAGSTATWRASRRQDLDTDLRQVAYLVVTPTNGTVRASATYASGESTWASLPLRSASTVVLAPGVYSLE